MYTRILNEKEILKFNELTGIMSRRVFVSRHNKYYSATIITSDSIYKKRISRFLVLSILNQ